MEPILDQPEHLKTLDKGGMLKALRCFPESCENAIETVERANIVEEKLGKSKEVTIAGVGGSAIGGLILCDWLLMDCPVPITVSRGYSLPRFVDKDTLVLIVSYSGNTEETISAFGEALERRSSIISITSGGEVQRLSAEKGLPLISLPKGLQPRAALPNQFFSLAVVMRRLGFVSKTWGEVDEVIKVLRSLRKDLVPERTSDENSAKQLAMGLKGLVPFVYGPRLFQAVAYRIGTQLNENSKIPAGSGFFPEVFHNAVMGCEGPEKVRKNTCALVIQDSVGSAEMRRKIDAFKGLFEHRIGGVLEIQSRGRGRLARMLSALYIGDYTSAYLGMLYGLDPSSVSSITAIKRA